MFERQERSPWPASGRPVSKKVKMASLNGRMHQAGYTPAADTDLFIAKKEAVKFINTFNQIEKMKRLAATAPGARSPSRVFCRGYGRRFDEANVNVYQTVA
ncbi:hypothetical protein [Pseudomonas asturiensis]|uniref:hypothetical protein n=1 Tax=Pseudomonas asturiensis TaxID=1190415 RepID=UPI001C314778|nr:hypothetical protein [Pseudomonas asturiensis]